MVRTKRKICNLRINKEAEVGRIKVYAIMVLYSGIRFKQSVSNLFQGCFSELSYLSEHIVYVEVK